MDLARDLQLGHHRTEASMVRQGKLVYEDLLSYMEHPSNPNCHPKVPPQDTKHTLITRILKIICMYVCACIYTYISLYIYTYVYVYVHVYMGF